ncbi:nitroreductase family protein [Mycolicibacterium thermoresistibile]|jgi:nitroreductase|uniref:Nitroreductase n=2 Tax=Mycolicibacterium thermoresistibile TaxID=1797 RepID=G7CNP0_MYCT3|nr:nitroreductase family protein [Mycolicibacterium thermoresistibile]EHI10444.1 nitroreductase [Mycolicibacterium thermoresistibile ATCC 19527]MCV7187627.1 nitroreductase family protein [Mycolicibacterium thermoresistibile]GAT13637.1 nitroreductase [Mycolicibacterium thermoresistibile]SNW17278.1 nitroreductase [Mycolicibacterium thermoresistibile]
MALNLSVDDVLTTTRSVRKRLDLEKPVPREVLMECLELALQAPTGSNAQGWQWVFVEDPDTKKALADIYRVNADAYLDRPRPSYDDVRGERMDRVKSSARYLSEHFHEVPVLLVPCLEGRPDNQPAGVTASFWGSLLPAVWSFMLALRSRGLGSAWTTLHLVGDGEQRAAEVLGIPFDRYSQAGLFPIAYTKGTDFRPAKRLPAEQVVHWNRW